MYPFKNEPEHNQSKSWERVVLYITPSFTAQRVNNYLLTQKLCFVYILSLESLRQEVRFLVSSSEKRIIATK